MPADAVDYAYYIYTDNEGNQYSLKQDKTWGANPDSGFSAAVGGERVLVKSPATRPREIVLQDPISSRITSRAVATVTATAWTTGNYTTTVKFRGLATGVVMTKVDTRDEHIRKTRFPYSKPEPV